MPPPTEPPSVCELRRCCGAHFKEEAWLACQARYLNLRLLIFNPAAHFANQAAACGPELPGELPPGERAADNPAAPPQSTLATLPRSQHTHVGEADKALHGLVYRGSSDGVLLGSLLIGESDCSASAATAREQRSHRLLRRLQPHQTPARAGLKPQAYVDAGH
ncbi:hypothetical protein EMIHUDRAFT_237159 [Emiliania huxleyi CCMP1516]|uniref:Uncharacterized protein n=2 Tax=Emiliania huxleyi TaxID=2903 RepID=A0A0D3JR87_EMIH1|nr:hypothetical protein EMIHUDRAFT_237159 [Emiliania huxleyi CCMP1516]EOD26022.1 hypothetical protein EMIHUDRAFT_237159 [Emiliania huxleyi CCMP1516]|eukprot:XP_005778451.1 hypothetical protein EMIHUDRAFT_237159 [Emiliania huxleyi CCMP1516]